jgi:3-phenylpropionate/cinnamic acid dioxygenase small subunit
MIEPAAVQDLIGAWWFNYDEGDFDALTAMLTEDCHFTVRTDTNTVAWAEFARADISGRDEVMAWQTEHRLASPYPLRHHGSNLHIVEASGNDASFASYIHVNHVVDEMPAPIPGGVVRGVVRAEPDRLRLAELHVVLDTMTSQPMSAVMEQR